MLHPFMRLSHFAAIATLFPPDTGITVATKSKHQVFRFYLTLFHPSVCLPPRSLDDALETLACMVIASAPVDTHRTVWSIKRADRALGLLEASLHESLANNEPETRSQSGLLPRIAMEIASVAARLTRSDSYIYLLNSAG